MDFGGFKESAQICGLMMLALLRVVWYDAGMAKRRKAKRGEAARRVVRGRVVVSSEAGKPDVVERLIAQYNTHLTQCDHVKPLFFEAAKEITRLRGKFKSMSVLCERLSK